MKVRLSHVESLDEKGRRSLNDNIDQLEKALNTVEFGDAGKIENISCFISSATTPATADTEFEVSHDLKRVPVGFLVINKSDYCDVRDSGTAWTRAKIYLESDATAIDVKILVF